MSISRRNDGRYVVKFKDGSKWKQKTFRAREDAEGFERSIQYDEPENTRLTVTESILLFLKNTRHCRKGVQYYALILSRMPEVLATRYVDSLDRRDLMTFRSTLQGEYKLSPCSINCHTSKLIAAWRWCASEDFLQAVPWEKYRPLPEGPHGHNCGSFGDFMKVYDACNPALQWFIRTCLALCLRPGKEAASAGVTSTSSMGGRTCGCLRSAGGRTSSRRIGGRTRPARKRREKFRRATSARTCTAGLSAGAPPCGRRRPGAHWGDPSRSIR